MVVPHSGQFALVLSIHTFCPTKSEHHTTTKPCQAGQKCKMVQAVCSKETGNRIEHNIEWSVLWRFPDGELQSDFLLAILTKKCFIGPLIG
jgi:hypothetical protein